MCFFAFLMIYLIIIPGDSKPWTVDPVMYCFYVVDFSVGFCSRILQGAIVNWIFGTANETNITIFLNVLMVLTFALYSHFAEKILLKIDSEYRKTAVLFLLLFFTGPCTFGMFVKIVGMVDFFWVFSTAIFFFIIQKKRLYFLIVPLFVFMVFIYYASLLSYVPFLALMLLYTISYTKEEKEKKYLTAVFFVSVIVTFSLGVYFVVFERSNLNYTFEEFNEYLMAKGVEEHRLFYYDYAFYRKVPYEIYHALNVSEISPGQNPSSPSGVLGVIRQQILVNFRIFTFTEATPLVCLLVTPVAVYIYRFIINKIRQEKDNKLRCFTLTCVLLLFPLTIITVLLFFSMDLVRWVGNAFIALFVSFLYILYKDGNDGWEQVHKDIESLNKFWLVPWYLLYMLTVCWPDGG